MCQTSNIRQKIKISVRTVILSLKLYIHQQHPPLAFQIVLFIKL